MNLVSRATISPCGLYRYALIRATGRKPHLCWLMLNPSTADGDVDDPTIRKCMLITHSLGYRCMSVVNLFAYRATDYRKLFEVEDPVGPRNDEYILHYARDAAMVIGGWGAKEKIDGRILDVKALLGANDIPLYALKVTSHGEPHHPLFLPKTSQPQLYWE